MIEAGFWTSAQDVLLLNPRLPADERLAFESAWQRDQERRAHSAAAITSSGCVGLATSGSGGRFKLVLLRKAALLASAQGVNEFLSASADDIWLKTLPEFHVGGLSIFARAYLCGARVVECSEAWSEDRFVTTLEETRATLTSLVPTQVFDLVRVGARAPMALRGVLVGGGRLTDDLYRRARELGWPLLPSYGLTECSSQVATAPLSSLGAPPNSISSPRLRRLPHIEVRSAAQGFIEIKSAALLEGYLWIEKGVDGTSSRFADPKNDGWFRSEDRGELSDPNHLDVQGRDQDFVKIGGESVDMTKLEARWEALRIKSLPSASGALPDVALLAVPDERLGHVVCLLHEGATESVLTRVCAMVEEFNTQVAPFERIRRLYALARIPRSSLGKLLRAAALASVEQNP